MNHGASRKQIPISSPDGRPLAVKVEESSGHTVLDEAALAAVRDWEFQPMMAGPLALASAVEVPVRFYLAKSEDH